MLSSLLLLYIWLSTFVMIIDLLAFNSGGIRGWRSFEDWSLMVTVLEMWSRSCSSLVITTYPSGSGISFVVMMSFLERVSRKEFFFLGSLLADVLIFTRGIFHDIFSLSFQVCSGGPADGAR